MSTPSTTTASRRVATGVAAVLGMALIAFEAMPAQAAPPPHAPAWGYRRKQQQQQQQRYSNYGTKYRDNYRTRRHHPYSNDLDGDGIVDSRDRDIDGDGILNYRDREPRTSARRRARSGNWVRTRAVSQQRRPVPYGYYRNSAGRLIRRPRTIRRATFTPRRERRIGRNIGDRDRDGIRNRRDRDIDGDGVRNRRDRNRDGDRFRNRRDRFDRNPRRH